MIKLTDRAGRLCDGLPRREILRVGGLGVLGAGLDLASLAASGGSDPLDRSFGRARSCILLFLMGGPPQHSTWDPKPDAPKEVRGDFGPIATSVPGLTVGELLPMTARVADKVCLLRAMSTGDNAHSSSGYYMLTGKPHAPMNFENANPGPPNDSPSLGALLGRVAPPRGGLPSAVTLPHRIFNTDGSVWPGQDAGLLGRTADPWLLNAKKTTFGLLGSTRSALPERPRSRRGIESRRRSLLDRLRQRTGPPRTPRLGRCLRPPDTRRGLRPPPLHPSPQGVPASTSRARGRSAATLWRHSLRPGRATPPPPGRGRRPARPGQLVSRRRRAARPTPAGTATPRNRPGSRTSSSPRWTGPIRL